MLLGRGRRLWMWLALCAAPAAVGLTVFPQAVHAETPEEEAARLAREAMSEAQRLKADFTAFEGNVAKLQGEIDSFPGTLLSQYKCPPEQPSKEAKYDELNQFRGRVNRLTVELNRLVDRRNQLGRAGEAKSTRAPRTCSRRVFRTGSESWRVPKPKRS